MGLGKRILEGSGAISKAVFNGLTRDNLPFNEGGGFSSLIIKKTLNPAGLTLATGGMMAYSFGKGGLEAHNLKTLGRTSYSGMTRMTSAYTSGAVEAMHRVSGGDYGAFAGMAENVVKSPGISHLDDFGANSKMISALYNMGGG